MGRSCVRPSHGSRSVRRYSYRLAYFVILLVFGCVCTDLEPLKWSDTSSFVVRLVASDVLQDLGVGGRRQWCSTSKFREKMGCVEAPLSLNGGCIAENIIPHYLRPSSGSCHDICKYGRRRASDDAKKHTLLSNKPSPDAKSFSPRPKNHSNSPTKRRCTSSETVMKGVVVLPAKLQVEDGKKPCQQLMKPSASVRPKPVMVKLLVSSESSDGVHGKRRRNDDALSGRNTGASMPSAKKAWVPVGAPLPPNTASSEGRKTVRVELKDLRGVKRVKTGSSNALESIPVPAPALPSSSSSSLFQEEEDDQEIKCSGHEVEIGNVQHVEENEIKIPRMEAESNKFEFESESVTDAPSSSSHEEADELVSDTTVSQRKRNHFKRQRRSRVVVRPGDKHCRPVKIQFRIGNQMHLHKEDNVPTRHKLRRTRSKADVSGSVSDSNKYARIGSLKASRSRDKYGSKASKNRRRRVRYGKTRVLVLENRKGDLKRKYEKEDAAGAVLLSRKNNLKHQEQLQRRKDVQCLFNYVVEETVSKLAERRKGMVKSLVGAFESLISLQTRSCFLRVTS